jgi:hypothetical protein
MTYQGERARPLASEAGRCFEVSRVRIAADGHVSNVLWSEVDGVGDRDVGPQVRATADEVIDAIHDGARVAAVFRSPDGPLPERAFVIVDHPDGRERLAFEGDASPGRDLADLPRMDR